MVDTNLALQAAPQAQALDTATPVRQMQQDQNNNAMAAEQTLKAHYDNMGERDKQRLQSTVIGAAQLKTYLDRDDVEGAHEFLVKRQAALHQRMGSGENVDTQETDYALQKLRTGDIDGLKNDVGAMLAAGSAYGMIGSGDNTPSSVREWQYYNSLPEDKKKEWLIQKRSGSTIDLGGSQMRLGPDGQPVATYDKTVSPDKQPENVSAAAAAKVTGTEQGVNEAKLADIQAAMPRLTQVADKLSQLGKTATYTKAGVAGNEVLRQLGAKVPQGAVDRTEYMAVVDNEVLPLLRQTFGAAFTQKEGEQLKVTLGDPNKTPEEKDAVLRAFIEQKMGEIETLQRRAGQTQTQAPAGPQGGAPQGNMVKISNGAETYWVSPEDAAAAAQEGFQQVQ